MNKNRYFIVGLFIIIVTIGMIFIGFWLAFGLNDTKYNTYLARFNESVDGLNLNAPVNYNGVNIGKVTDINIDHKNPSIVIVTMQIQEGVPIFTNTYASLVPQGITGQVYISFSLKGKSPQAALPPTKEAPFPVIQTKASFLTNIVNQMSVLAEQVTNISKRVGQIVDTDNVKKVDDILSNLQTISNSIAKNSQAINQSLTSLNIVLKNAAISSNKLNSLMSNVEQASKAIAATSQDVSKISQSLQTQTIQGFNNVILPELGQTLASVNQSARELNQLVSKLNNNPSILVRGQTTAITSQQGLVHE